MDKQEILRSLPRVDDLTHLAADRIKTLPLVDGQNELFAGFSQTLILKCARIVLESLREGIKSGKISKIPLLSDIIDMVLDKAKAQNAYSLRPVINATGVVLHTNLGRAVLSQEAAENVAKIASSYSTLEYDIKSGGRGSRQTHIEDLIVDLTGAEAAIAVNNNAAAVMLTLMTMCKGREVIVSRGELVEIGGSFRVPEIMSLSGCQLKEVGTTNKTKLSDYEKAINTSSIIRPYAPCDSSRVGMDFNGDFGRNASMGSNGASSMDFSGTDNCGFAKDSDIAANGEPLHTFSNVAALLKVHTSNFKIVGFSESVEISDLKRLGERYGIPVIYDLGSGLMGDEFIRQSGDANPIAKNCADYDVKNGENCTQTREKSVKVGDESIKNAALSLEGTTGETTVLSAIKSGADVVCFSGDKLFGGSQAGIIVGKKRFINAIKRNQFARVVRIDKLTLAALEATLRAYSDPLRAAQIPTISSLTAPLSLLKNRAERLKKLLALSKSDLKKLEKTLTNTGKNAEKSAGNLYLAAEKNAEKLRAYTVTVKESCGMVGGGTAPGEDLPSYVVEVFSPAKSATAIEVELRNQSVPIIARIQKDRVILDVRTIFDKDLELVAKALKRVLLNGGGV